MQLIFSTHFATSSAQLFNLFIISARILSERNPRTRQNFIMISSASKALKFTKKNFNQRLIFDAWLKCRMQTEIKHCVMIGDQTFLQHTKTTWEVFQRGSFAAAAASRDHNKFQFWKKWKEQNFLDFSSFQGFVTWRHHFWEQRRKDSNLWQRLGIKTENLPKLKLCCVSVLW